MSLETKFSNSFASRWKIGPEVLNIWGDSRRRKSLNHASHVRFRFSRGVDLLQHSENDFGRKMNRLIVISGCSGGGKSTLLTELGRRGYPVVEEPGRRVVADQMRSNRPALPWTDMISFLHRVSALARSDLKTTNASDGWIFFDRGLVDAVTALQHATGDPLLKALAEEVPHYYKLVFLVPPWPEIYVQDSERRHSLDDASEEYLRLLDAYPALGYHVHIIPKTTVVERADYVLSTLRTCMRTFASGL